MSIDYTHLNALKHRLSNECFRLSIAKTEGEKLQRRVWIRQIEKEIEDERKFLGLAPVDCNTMTDDELLRELSAEHARRSK